MKRMLVAVTLLSLAAAAAAETGVTVVHFDQAIAKSRWTPEALAGARPMPLPRTADWRPAPVEPATDKGRAAAEPFEDLFPSYAEEPRLPDAERARFRQKLFDLSGEELRLLRGLDDAPLAKPEAKDYGSAGLDYTSSRLIPSSAVESFPYSAVGRLFFSDGSDNFVCTASVIARRLIVTAGHCVHDGPGRGMFQDFLYVPAYFRGEAPYGTWAATAAFVTGTWAASGEVPHPHDFALLAVEDQNGSPIADVTGRLAFRPDHLSDNHLTLLGYPSNLDDGEEMHQVWSGDYVDFVDNTVVYGSDMGGGSSGGPWVQNFNRKAVGQAGGRNRARAAVVGVTSYGFEGDELRAQGASILNRQFRLLYQEACQDQSGNC